MFAVVLRVSGNEYHEPKICGRIAISLFLQAKANLNGSTALKRQAACQPASHSSLKILLERFRRGRDNKSTKISIATKDK